MYACKCENENIFEKLIELGADINKKNKNGITPLIYSQVIVNKNITKILNNKKLNNEFNVDSSLTSITVMPNTNIDINMGNYYIYIKNIKM